LIKVEIWKNPHPPQLGGPLEIPSQRGVSKAKFLMESMNQNWNLKRDWRMRVQIKKILHGGYELSFWNYTNI